MYTGNKHQPRSAAFTFRVCLLFALFLVISGVGKNSPRYLCDDSDLFLGKVDSEAGMMSLFCCGLFWTSMDSPCSTGSHELKLGEIIVS
jgi:hypothetical protein